MRTRVAKPKLQGIEMPAAARADARLQAQIAEAAYYRAERRGFAPGQEIEDWLAAEAEVLARVGADERPS
jgi:secreted protein with Ig-like and vWFA domain